VLPIVLNHSPKVHRPVRLRPLPRHAMVAVARVLRPDGSYRGGFLDDVGRQISPHGATPGEVGIRPQAHFGHSSNHFRDKGEEKANRQ
jgi:hypothetical protein